MNLRRVRFEPMLESSTHGGQGRVPFPHRFRRWRPGQVRYEQLWSFSCSPKIARVSNSIIDRFMIHLRRFKNCRGPFIRAVTAWVGSAFRRPDAARPCRSFLSLRAQWSQDHSDPAAAHLARRRLIQSRKIHVVRQSLGNLPKQPHKSFVERTLRISSMIRRLWCHYQSASF